MKKRQGFTLVELLVVIAIIGVLVALLLPAVQAAREAARRMSCSNKLKQVGLALHNYHDTHNKFPPDAIWSSWSRNYRVNEPRHFSFLAMILPYMEQSPLYDQINFSLPGYNQVINGETLQSIQLPLFVCPSEASTDGNKGWGYSSYGGNAGWAQVPYMFGASQHAGPFSALDSANFANCTDGTSNTIFVGEVTMAGFAAPTGVTTAQGGAGNIRKGSSRVCRSQLLAAQVQWWNHSYVTSHPNMGGNTILRADGSSGAFWGPWSSNYILGPTYRYAYHMNNNWPGPGSYHPAGAMFCLMDASVRFIPESISTGVDANGNISSNTSLNGHVWGALHTMSGITNEVQPTLD